MSIVHNLLPEARVLDLCAGSGALGLEALSRGAAACDFVENDPRAIAVIRANLDGLGGHAGALVHREDAAHFVSTLGALAYDVAFADPPYAAETGALLVQRWLEVPFAAVFGVEHSSSISMPSPGQTRRYGTTSLTFFRASDT
jgi:16S rRNA (guanine966-N2)-methyltransferase